MQQEMSDNSDNNDKVYFAVIDTNVLVSALLSKKPDAATVLVVNAFWSGRIIPLYHEKILMEYNKVLHRKKFYFPKATVDNLILHIQEKGLRIPPTPTDEFFPDKDDIIFYEIAMTKRDEKSWLITGNDKHYPKKHFVVTPKTMMDILDGIIDPNELHD